MDEFNPISHEPVEDGLLASAEINAEALPEKFRDPETGAPRIDALIKSYGELERKLAGMVRVPGDGASPEEADRFRRLLGVPDSPDGYRIRPKNDALESDPDVNRRLHEAGFTPTQAQLVYDLAADYVVPLLNEVGSEFEAERQLGRLVEYYGGAEAWHEASRQLLNWGRANLPAEVLAALSGTAEGVVALDNMMRSGEPLFVNGGQAAEGARNETELDEMIRDPRYWRHREPGFVARVTEGFRRLYPD